MCVQISAFIILNNILLQAFEMFKTNGMIV